MGPGPLPYSRTAGTTRGRLGRSGRHAIFLARAFHLAEASDAHIDRAARRRKLEAIADQIDNHLSGKK